MSGPRKSYGSTGTNSPVRTCFMPWYRRDNVCPSRKREFTIEQSMCWSFLRLTHVIDELAGNLSGGQKKLLELGRAMMADPDIVLLDEPGAGVNPTLLGDLAEMIERLNKERAYTFCIIEHNMDMIARLCDPVIVMVEGAVLMQGDMEYCAR